MNNSLQVLHRLPGRVRLRLPAIKANKRRADSLEWLLSRITGVTSATCNPQIATVTIRFDPAQFNPFDYLSKLDIDELDGAQLPARRLPARSFFGLVRRATYGVEERLRPGRQLLLSSAALAITLFEAPVVVTAAACGIALAPVLNRALQTLLEERRLGGDFLDGTTCVLLIRQQTFLPASLMTFLISLGEFMRDMVTRRCEDMIQHQLELFEHSVWLVKKDKRVRTPVAKLKPGDQIVIYPGEVITCEGTIVRGRGTIVPATPEEDIVPIVVGAGDFVPSNMVLTEGKLYIEFETCLEKFEVDPVQRKHQRRWLQRTQLHRNAMRQGYDRVWLTMAAASAVYGITGSASRALPILCFDFLTGVRIAIPTAVLSSMYKAGKQGMVVRNASALEKLSEVDAIIFARSGVLTAMHPSVTEVYVSDGYTIEQVSRYAAALEQRYHHLAAYAISSYANLTNLPVPERHKVHSITGLGIGGDIEDHLVLVGSTRLMELRDIDIEQARPFLDTCKQRGDSRACVAIDGKLAGIIAYQDPLRPGTSAAVTALREMGISEIAMSTGASQAAAEAFARRAQIETVFSRMSPQDKVNVVRKYKQQGKTVAFVGYDVADVGALEEADVAITLSSGMDAARYRADVVVTSDSLACLAEGIRIAREGMTLAKQNLVVTAVPNWAGLGVSVINESDVLGNTLLNNGSVIVGAINGLRPLLETSEFALEQGPQ